MEIEVPKSVAQKLLFFSLRKFVRLFERQIEFENVEAAFTASTRLLLSSLCFSLTNACYNLNI